MARADTAPTLAALEARLVARAVESRDVPPAIARKAGAATRRAFSSVRTFDRSVTRRAEAYFGAVVRRSLVRSRTSPAATGRFIIDAVVSDLVGAGRAPEAVWDELQRAWRDKVPGEVLEEYRQRLCA